MKKLFVNEKLRNVIPALSAEEYAALELSIKTEGCREAILVWREDASAEIPTIIDGHNRYEICVKNNVEFETIEIKFPDVDHVIEWMITNQISRRNLQLYKRACLALDLAEILKQRGKEKEKNRKSKKTDESDFRKFAKVDTIATVAKQFGVSEGTIGQVKFIKEKEHEISYEIIQQLNSGDIRIWNVYSSLKRKSGGNQTSRKTGKTVKNDEVKIDGVLNKSTPSSPCLLDTPVNISSAAAKTPLKISENITGKTCSSFEEALTDAEELNVRERAHTHLMQFVAQFEGYSCLADEVEEIKNLIERIRQYNVSCVDNL